MMLFQGPILIMLAVVLAMFGVCWWFRTPGPDEYELPTVYTADNLKLGGMYDVAQGRCIQAFVVKNIRDGLFFIHVVPDDPKKDPKIIGWATRLPSNQLIRQENLLQFLPI